MNHRLYTAGKGKTWPNAIVLLAEVILLGVLAVGASSHYGMADGMRITLAYLVAYLVPRTLLRRACGTSLAGCVILLLLSALLIRVEFMRLTWWTFFDDYSLQMPNLAGDGRGYYKWALHRYDGRVDDCVVVFPGFPMMMLALWKVLGLNAVWPQALNLMFTLTAVVLTGMTTRRLLSGRVTASPQVLLAGGMALMCLLCYFLMMGTSILKEGPLCFTMSLTGFALAPMNNPNREPQRFPWGDLLLFTLACALTALVRTTYLYFILMGVAVMMMYQPRRKWRLALAMVTVVAISLLGGNAMSSYSFARHVEIAGGGWNMQRFFVDGDSQRFYHNLLNYYFLRPTWHKVLMLPLTMGVQFVIPLPWAYYENPVFLNMLSRLTWGWYAIGGISLFYFLALSWRRDGNMGCWPWWAALSYAAVAYVMAGSVARYAVPIQPLFIPVAMYVICRLREGRWRRAFLGWSVLFVILMAVVLLFCFEAQQDGVSKMLHMPPLFKH